MSKLIVNGFLFHRSLIAIVSLAMLSIAMYADSYEVVIAMATAQFWANLLSLGLPIHLRRSKNFILDYKNSLFLYIVALICLLLLATVAKYTSYKNAYAFTAQLAVLHLFSLLIFSASTYYSGRHKTLIFVDISTLAICYLIFIIFNDWLVSDMVVLFILIFKLSIFIATRRDFFHMDILSKAIPRREIITGAMSNTLAVIPMILVTDIYLDVSMEAPPYAEFLLRLNAIFSIVFVSSFSFLKSRDRMLNEAHQKIFILSYALLILGICYCTHIYIKSGALEDKFYIALLPLVTTSAVWAKQNIIYNVGPAIILMFNFTVSALIIISGYFLKLDAKYILLLFTLLYTCMINMYFIRKKF